LISAKIIPPGGEGKIDVTFLTGSRSGRKNKTISVETDDPGHKTVKLRISADVQLLLTTKPDRVNFGRVKKKDESIKYILLIGRDKEKAKIISTRSNNKFVKVDINHSGFEGDKNKKIKITVLSGMNLGRFREKVIIYTDHKRIKKLETYVTGEIIGDIVISPQYLYFGEMIHGKEQVRTIRMKSTSDDPFRVLDIKSTISEIQTILEKVKEGKEYRVKVVLTQKFNKDLLKGKIIIKTNIKDQEKIEVKVLGRMNRVPKL